jgi:hypothetical protein
MGRTLTSGSSGPGGEAGRFLRASMAPAAQPPVVTLNAPQ